jgi:hypothetical protein
MTYHRLNRRAEARQALARAVEHLERLLRERDAGHFAGIWSSRFELQALRREAEAMLNGAGHGDRIR